jgi:hypothetical protein
LIFTERDQRIIFDLQAYGIFKTKTLATRHFPGVALTTTLRRLRALEGDGYIQRISGLDGGSFGWAVTKKAAQKFQFSSAKINFPRFILDHDLKLTDLRLRLEGVGLARSWTPEHEIRARVAKNVGLSGLAQRNIPDGLMGIEVNTCQETLAIELELSTKNQKRYERIFRDYREKKSLWGFWYLVKNATIGRQLTKAAREHFIYGNRPRLLWSVLNDVMNDSLNCKVHMQKETIHLRDLWTPEIKKEQSGAAHLPAQGVSGLAYEETKGESELTHENKTGTIAD